MRASISNDGLSEALSQTERQATGSGVCKQVREGGRSTRREHLLEIYCQCAVPSSERRFSERWQLGASPTAISQ